MRFILPVLASLTLAAPALAEDARIAALDEGARADLLAGALSAFGCSFNGSAEMEFVSFARTYAADELALTPADAAALEGEIDDALEDGIDALIDAGRLTQDSETRIVTLSPCD